MAIILKSLFLSQEQMRKDFESKAGHFIYLF